MPAQSINDVITALDTIVQQAHETQSRLGNFAALYRRVTIAVRAAILAGRFEDGSRMEKLDVVFAERYLDALATFQAGRVTTRSWMLAFQATADPDLLAIQHLLAGMNAHINLDLGIATAQVSSAGELSQLKPDFDLINIILADQISTVSAELAAVSPLLGNLEQIDMRTATSLINFNIVAARDAAWCAAERLSREPQLLHELTIDGIDLAVSIAGRAILYPSHGHCNALQLIQRSECHDVRTIIETLSQGDPSAIAITA